MLDGSSFRGNELPGMVGIPTSAGEDMGGRGKGRAWVILGSRLQVLAEYAPLGVRLGAGDP